MVDSVGSAGGREIAISETKGGNPTPEVVPRFRAKDHQLDFIAKLTAVGISPKAIEVQAGVPRGYVENLINNARTGKSKKFAEFLDTHREEVTKKVGDHAYKLGDLLGASYLALKNALEGTDLKLAADKGEKVIEMWQGAVGLNPSKSSESASVQINNPEQVNLLISVQQEMNSHLKENVGSIKGMPSVLDDPHILIGEAALPTPEAQLEVKPGDALESDEPPLETTWYSETNSRDPE